MKQSAPRVVHLTTVHQRRDTRIFEKQLRSLADAGLDVHLVVTDGKGDEQVDGIQVHDIGPAPFGRAGRMLLQGLRVWRTARRLRPALVHFHDPELLWVGRLMQAGGVQAVYDSHEDVPRDILSKSWIAPGLRPAVSRVTEWVENRIARRLAAVVAATPHIRRRFEPVARRAVDVNNYPVFDRASVPAVPRDPKGVCYVGTIEPIRGIFEMIRALEHVDARFVLAGPWDQPETEARARALPGWARVDYRGRVGRAEAWAIMAAASAGLVVLHPAPNHIDAQPTKMFEYMAAGTPVVASDFPLWRDIVEGAGCGRCVDPMSPSAIADALRVILADAAGVQALGEAGRRAVAERYSWAPEARKLVALYQALLGPWPAGTKQKD